jgi:hypothetical protein
MEHRETLVSRFHPTGEHKNGALCKPNKERRHRSMNPHTCIKNGIITLACLAGTLTYSAPAADLTGKWQAEFDTQIGRQKYLFDFKVEGDKVTGKAPLRHYRQKTRSRIAERQTRWRPGHFC